jgi:hypothetical protein
VSPPALVERSSTILQLSRDADYQFPHKSCGEPSDLQPIAVELRSTGQVGHLPLRGHCRDWGLEKNNFKG